jgi:sialic acid synthase SpsE
MSTGGSAAPSTGGFVLKRPGGGDFMASDYEALLGERAAADIRGGYQLKKADVLT